MCGAGRASHTRAKRTCRTPTGDSRDSPRTRSKSWDRGTWTRQRAAVVPRCAGQHGRAPPAGARPGRSGRRRRAGDGWMGRGGRAWRRWRAVVRRSAGSPGRLRGRARARAVRGNLGLRRDSRPRTRAPAPAPCLLSLFKRYFVTDVAFLPVPPSISRVTLIRDDSGPDRLFPPVAPGAFGV